MSVKDINIDNLNLMESLETDEEIKSKFDELIATDGIDAKRELGYLRFIQIEIWDEFYKNK